MRITFRTVENRRPTPVSGMYDAYSTSLNSMNRSQMTYSATMSLFRESSRIHVALRPR